MTATHPLPQTPRSNAPLIDDGLIALYDDAISHLARARDSRPEDQKQCISTVVKILNHLKESDEKKQAADEDEADFRTLYDYMIDRLSISHSGLGIDPINEVSWLIRTLRELSTTPKRPSTVSG
ncbi:flagellar protein FliS [Desulfoluna sp.]|uniref:flagellar protein FliS n=1 Tax=Desulfoluna sp. TaxID=2045199 RepID=UPI00261D56A3|nr:flagellar protein FliS [Desulfoluna sp.]